MKLRLKQGTQPPQPLDVQLDGDPWGSDLVDALVSARLLSEDDRGGLLLARSGRALDTRDALSSLGVRHGDLLTTQPSWSTTYDAAELPTRAEARLVVGSGPDEGRTIAAPSTGVTVGRDRETDLSLTDPGLSRSHFEIAHRNDRWVVRDLGSRNGTFHAGSRVGDRDVELVPGLPIEAGNSLFRIELRGQGHEEPRIQVREGLGQYNRTPRVARPGRRTRFELKAPPAKPSRMRVPLLAALAPLVAAPIFVLAGGGVAFLALALLSPLTILVSWWEDRIHGGKDHREAVADYRRLLDDSTVQVAEAVRANAQLRWATAPDPHELATRALPTTALWERRPHDDDFLSLRFGWGETPTEVGYEVGEGGDPELTEDVRTQLDPLLISGSSPLVVDLREVDHIGVVAEGAMALTLQTWPMFQLAVLNSPREVLVAAIVPDRTPWGWLARLPHAQWRERGAVAAGEVEARELVRELGAIVEERATQDRSRIGGEGRHGQLPALVTLVDDAVELPRNLVTTLLEEGPAVGVHLLWFTDSRAGVPGHCGAVLSTSGTLTDATWTRTGASVRGASLDQVQQDTVDEASWLLTGLRDASSRDRRAEVPSQVSLVDTLGMSAPTAELITQRWSGSTGLGAPLGIGVEGVVEVDLREDGPHALLGGTTGAGKSELLQTLVGSLAATNPPDRLTFLLVDYKGGAAFKDCVELPHTVGMVTDLDGHLVSRVLVSLNAELSHREHALASVGAKDLIDMQRKAPDRAPPSLLLVVDEFAALATELPEFVDGMVNLAQRGRSLGMHLLLATQRPAGAINDNIRANTNLRISLRMNDREDSEDVIASPVAAALPRTLPGRAYIRTGSTELVEVQVAYSGGQAFGAREEVARVTVAVPGRASTVAVRTVEPDEVPATDLQMLVGTIRQAFVTSGHPEPRVPWLPPLPELLPVDELTPEAGTRVAIGLRDEPQQQSQVVHSIDVVADGGLLVAGSSSSGKTTALRTLACGLAAQNDPEAVQIYALDFGSRGLFALAELPHVGDVVASDETDKVVRLLTMLDRAIKERRALMAEHDVASFDDLVKAQESHGMPRTPRLVVLLDGYASFVQAYERVEYGAWVDRVPALISNGAGVGIHWVLTADRRLSVPTAVQSLLAQRLLLRFNDPDEYDGFGLPRAKTAGVELASGRAFSAAADEVQVAVLGGDPTEAAQASAVHDLALRLRARHPGSAGAPRVRLLPHHLPVDGLPLGRLSSVPVGVRDLDFETAALDLERGSLLIAGARRSGKSTALSTAATTLHAAEPDVELVLLSPRSTPLSKLPFWSAAHEGKYPVADAVDELLLGLDTRGPDSKWLVVVVDDADEFLDEMADTSLANLAARGADVRVRILAAADKTAARRAYGGLLQRLRAERAGLVLQPDPDVDGDLFDAPIERRLRGGPPGRAVLVTAGSTALVQVSTSEPAP